MVAVKPIFCDMDGVLVNQTGRDGFDSMPWRYDGRVLWDFLKPLRPTILSMLLPDIYERCAPQKSVWCARELGADVSLIVTTDIAGKAPYATRGAILIDDNAQRHREAWTAAGGIFLHHVSSERTIETLRRILA